MSDSTPIPQPLLTTPEEDRQIEAAFQDVLDGYLRSNHRKKVEIVERAFRFAREAHKGIRRRSGEPYILHPIAVARIASREIGLGSTSICAALLHDVVEDTDYTVEDIERNFGAKVAQLVDGLTKISGGIFGDKASAQAENFRKLLLTMNEDIRVVLIKMADRLHNMRTLGSMAPNKQYKIAGETLYIYAPLAHRLGLFAIKTELEDLSFKYEHPAAYANLSDLISESAGRRDVVANNFLGPIRKRLTDMGLAFEAKARLKSVYSIWRKMETKHIPFEEVYDLYAVRIIFDNDDPNLEKEICWKIYSAITDLYRPHPDRTRDWITTPKANGYQALHVTLMGPDGNWIEVQIRSRRMDEIAEKGFAAHWRYKTGESEEETELNEWMKAIKEVLDDPNPNAIDFLGTLKLNLFASEIVVFTPKGEMVTLPTGSTVLDMAFNLHTFLGTHCIAAKVNHKLMPLSHRLSSGDQVEILTSQNQTPKEEWASLLVTARAKTALRQALRREQQPLVEEGRRRFREFLEAKGLEESNDLLSSVIHRLGEESKERFFIKLARDEVKLDTLFEGKSERAQQSFLSKLWRMGRGLKKTKETPPAAPLPAAVAPPNVPARVVDTRSVYTLRSDGHTANYVMAHCCSPIPGDDVMGFVNSDGNVEVHALTCPRAQALKASYGSRIVATRWEVSNTVFPARIRIEGIDRHGILQELTYAISTEMNIDIRGLNIRARDEVFDADLNILVADTSIVDKLCQKIMHIGGVRRADRLH